MVNNSVIPQDILVSNGFGSKPDLVVISRSNKRIALFELTCPLERNIHTANTYKREKYSGMQGDLEDKGWKVHLVPYEVSSRGQILKSTKSSIILTLKQFKIKIKAEQQMFKQLSKIVLLSTFSIFHAYQTKEWVSPPLLKPWLIQNWLAVGSGLPRNDYVWPIVLNLCYLLEVLKCKLNLYLIVLQCNKFVTFYDKPSLTKHVKAVHINLKTYKCPSCDFKTSLMEYLALHTKRVHIDVKSPKDVLEHTWIWIIIVLI